MSAHKILHQSGFDADGVLTYRASCRCEWEWTGTDRADWMRAVSDHLDAATAIQIA